MNHSIKNYQLLVVIIAIGYFFAGCGLGKQPPKSKSIAISPDKKTIVSVVSVLHVTQIRKTGGSTFRSGHTKNYLNFYDAVTGKQKNKTPIKIDITGDIVLLTNSCVYLKYYDQKYKRLLLNIYDIQNGDLLYNSEKLSEINNNILLDATSSYHHIDYVNPLLFKGDDSKIYKINESNGKYEWVADDLTQRYGNSFTEFKDVHYFRNDSFYLEIKGINRKQVFFETLNSKKTAVKQKQSFISAKDFIDAKIIGKKELILSDGKKKIDDLPVIKDTTIFILSKTKDSQQFEWMITALKLPSLETVWTQTLTNPLHLLEHEKINEIVFDDHNMMILTSQSINCLNTRNGNIVYSNRYINEIDH
jgi:hypothetical protein